MSFGMFDDMFLPNVGPTFLTCCRHVVTCQDDMSFGGSQRRDVTPTFPTKVGGVGGASVGSKAAGGVADNP